MRTDYQHLIINQDGGVVTITMNRPDVLNALTTAMLDELGEAAEATAADAAVRCVVLTGAGQDLNDFAARYAGTEPAKVSDHLAKYHRVLRAIRSAPKPVIAAVQGVAAGASCNLALACDLRIAADNARFIEAFARIGLVPDAGGGFLLPRLVGLGKALELALLADEVSGPEAARIGLVNFCVPLAEFPQATQKLAQRLANGPTTAYALIKELLYRSAESDLNASLVLEGQLQDIAINTADHREGVTAFLAKRPPKYNGA
jgi:2-(1,2-epoxy-1,2-dihydrophenyl)acetyl-CoA isomerase